MDAVVADLDGDLTVREVWSDERGLDFNVGLFPGVQRVPVQKCSTTLSKLLLLLVTTCFYGGFHRLVWSISQSVQIVSH